MIPGLVEETKVVVTCEGTTATPFKVSLTNTFVNAVPPVYPFVGAPASSLATIGAAVTGTVTVAVSQLLGFNTSQIW